VKNLLGAEKAAKVAIALAVRAQNANRDKSVQKVSDYCNTLLKLFLLLKSFTQMLVGLVRSLITHVRSPLEGL